MDPTIFSTDPTSRVVVNSNKQLPELKAVELYGKEPHGASVAGLVLIDRRNNNLSFTVKFDTDEEIKSCLMHIVESLGKYKPVGTYFRNFTSTSVSYAVRTPEDIVEQLRKKYDVDLMPIDVDVTEEHITLRAYPRNNPSGRTLILTKK